MSEAWDALSELAPKEAKAERINTLVKFISGDSSWERQGEVREGEGR